MGVNGSRVQRGHVVSISFIVGLPEPKTRDVEHTVPRFFRICILIMFAREEMPRDPA